MYNKARTSQLQSDWSAFNEVKKQVQRESRKAHDKYVSDIINPDNKRSNKKFWSLLNQKMDSIAYLLREKSSNDNR